MPKFRCSDIGIPCAWVGLYDTEQKLMKKIREHAKQVHGLNPIPPDVMEQIMQAITK